MAEPERLDVILRRLVPTGARLPDAPADGALDPVPEPSCAVCGDRGFVYPNLPVDHPDHGKAVACQCRVQHLEATKTDRLRRYSNLGPLVRLTFDTLDIGEQRFPQPAQRSLFRNAVQACRMFAEEPRGWIVLTGGPGSGKTHLAAAVANLCVENGHAAYFITIPDLLDHLRASYAPDSPVSFDTLFELVKSTPVLVLDDLGLQASTAWAQEKLYQLLNSRSLSALPTVITLGVAPEQLDERIRGRLGDAALVTHYALDLRRDAPNHLEEAWELPHLKRMTFENLAPPAGKALTADEAKSYNEVREAALEYAQRPRGWFVLGGLPGTGKTHIVAAIGARLRQQGQRVLFATASDLLDYLRNARDDRGGGMDELFWQVRQAPVLVLDDLGAYPPTPWGQEKLFQLLNYRYNAGLPTLITYRFNTRNDEVTAILESRLAARIRDQSISRHLLIRYPPYAEWTRPDRRAATPPAANRAGGRAQPEQNPLL